MASKSDSEQDNLRTDYEQTNEQIRMLTDIRFKLLTLIPTGTVVAVSVLGTTVPIRVVPVVGILGFVIVFAIAMYDLRNSQLYDASLNRAIQLESQLHIPDGGLYMNRPKRGVKLLGVLVWHDRALALIYGTTLGGWFYLIAYSSLNILLPSNINDVFYPALILFSAVVAGAFIWHFHFIEATRSNRELTIHSVSPYAAKNQTPESDSLCVSVTISLENSGIHSFQYSTKEIQLLDERGGKYPEVRLKKDKIYENELSKEKFYFEEKGTIKKKERKYGFLVFKLPKERIPVKLNYNPHPEFLNISQTKDLDILRKNIILIRHGHHEDATNSLSDKETSLNLGGRYMVSRLKNHLTYMNLIPEVYLTSPYTHARETAEIISERPDVIYDIGVLTPGKINRNVSLEAIFEEAKQKSIKLNDITTIAIVGHEPGLSNILKCLTSEQSASNINRAEAVWVKASRLSDFLSKGGVIQGWISGDNGFGGREGQEGV